MTAGPSKSTSSVVCSDDPPPLSITLKKTRDLPKKMKQWSRDHLPVDILLLTVEDCELLACYHYLRDPSKSYERSIGYVYFGKIGEEDGSLKVALLRCSKESADPGGSQTAAKNAITLLNPKATFLVGFCYSLNADKAQLGDVVLSSMLATDFNKTPVSRDVGKLIRSAADGWEAPLENPEARKVNVHRDGEILSCCDLNGAKQQCHLHPGAIAVEMEGKGLFAAAHDLKIEWLVVKGVCGFVHGAATSNDSWKTFASVMAASVVSNMLSNSFVFRDWPHYGLRDISTGEESFKSDNPSENKRRRLADTDVEKFIDIEENRNTERKTEGDLSLVMAFLAREKENRKIEDLPPAELDTYLSRFLLTERKKSGEEYKPATLKGIIASVERYLKKRGYSDSIITVQPFAKTLDALKSKQNQLKWLGKGNKPKDAASFDQEEIDLLFRKGVMGIHSPQALINTLWFNNCLHFNIRGGKAHRNLRWEDVVLKTDCNGKGYLEYSAERQKRTRPGDNSPDRRQIKPQIYENLTVPIERNPVSAFRLYMTKRPKETLVDGWPFYLTINHLSEEKLALSGAKWFKSQPMGVNKLNTLMIECAKAADLDTEKQITNHNAKETLCPDNRPK